MSNISWLEDSVYDANAYNTTTHSRSFEDFDTHASPSTRQQPEMPFGQGPPPASEVGYIPAYLLRNIGKNIRAEFVIGTAYLDKVGKLIEVGVNYFVLDDVNSKTNVMCDLYSVKFVTVIV